MSLKRLMKQRQLITRNNASIIEVCVDWGSTPIETQQLMKETGKTSKYVEFTYLQVKQAMFW